MDSQSAAWTSDALFIPTSRRPSACPNVLPRAPLLLRALPCRCRRVNRAGLPRPQAAAHSYPDKPVKIVVGFAGRYQRHPRAAGGREAAGKVEAELHRGEQAGRGLRHRQRPGRQRRRRTATRCWCRPWRLILQPGAHEEPGLRSREGLRADRAAGDLPLVVTVPASLPVKNFRRTRAISPRPTKGRPAGPRHAHHLLRAGGRDADRGRPA